MTVYVITHKPFDYAQKLSKGYVPMMVGANFNDNPRNYLTDNTMDNISDKNPQYCELTGLYWIWKNSHANKVGLPTIVDSFIQEVLVDVLQCMLI